MCLLACLEKVSVINRKTSVGNELVTKLLGGVFQLRTRAFTRLDLGPTLEMTTVLI
jgi:hypothetical protein